MIPWENKILNVLNILVNPGYNNRLNITYLDRYKIFKALFKKLMTEEKSWIV